MYHCDTFGFKVLRTVTMRNELGKRRGTKMGLGRSLALPGPTDGSYGRVLRTVYIRRGEFHESRFFPIRVSSVFHPWLTILHFFRQIAYRRLGAARRLW